MPGGKGKGEGMGPIGNCVCVKCGYSTFKKPGIPCMDEKCPKCGTVLLREGSVHYKNAVKNKNKKR
jgi:NAD-dependent SIR2 family protein deacetylase